MHASWVQGGRVGSLRGYILWETPEAARASSASLQPVQIDRWSDVDEEASLFLSDTFDFWIGLRAGSSEVRVTTLEGE